MPDWSITITKPSGGPTQFSPDPLTATEGDTVSWANETGEAHQIAVEGGFSTDLIEPFQSSSPAFVCQESTTYKCTVTGHSESGTIKVTALLLFALLIGIVAPPARAQSSTPIDCGPIVGQPLQAVPEIPRSGSIVRGTLVTAGANARIAYIVFKDDRGLLRRMPGSLLLPDGKVDTTKIQCYQQWVRAYSKDAPRGSQEANAPVLNPLPGPTIRARVGDLVELTFLNLIDPLRFPRADIGKCDQTSTVLNGKVTPLYPGTDKYPDCFGESINTNVHFHGTHTNPASTGDNVFLQIKPSPRAANAARTPAVDADSVRAAFTDFFGRCEAELPSATVPKQWPRLWSNAPKPFRDWADQTVQKYAPDWYVQNQNAVANGAWPQNYVGAVPYCFRLPDYTPTTWPPAPQAATMSAHAEGAGAAEHDETQAPLRPLIMGQAPGTHWYHAHKHGSTTINVSNGMTGVFIIEGKYDDEIKAGYPGGITQQVMVIQQLGGVPNLERGRGADDPYFSINGILQPVITMRPGEVQWWRIANTSSRAGVYFLRSADFKWKQIAQDGVQFNDANYQASNSNEFLLASGNRADLLVQAPQTAGSYTLLVNNSVDPVDRPSTAKKLTLLTVKVAGTSANMSFLSKAPSFPPFLTDIQASEVKATRTIVFATQPLPPAGAPPPAPQHTIDGKLFDGEVGAAVVLNQVEEWKIVNETFPNKGGNQIAHPFHIHINPFQVVELFDPNATIPGTTTPQYVTTNPQTGQCLINLSDPATWKPCASVPAPANIWWDVFSIPSGANFTDSAGKTVQVAGYFKMRSRFVDYAGYYVIHCHILAHEDRGMMTVVYVTPLQPPFSHH